MEVFFRAGKCLHLPLLLIASVGHAAIVTSSPGVQGCNALMAVCLGNQTTAVLYTWSSIFLNRELPGNAKASPAQRLCAVSCAHCFQLHV